VNRPLVTVKTLIAASRARGEIELSADALITPAAADWLRGTRVPVRRVDVAGPGRDEAPTVYLIGDEAQPDMQTLLPGLERRYPGLAFLPCHGRRSGLLAAVREMCDGLREGSGRRGVILVSNGAVPNCVANKYAHVRAAIVSQPSALFALQRELGINVLVFERGRLSLRQTRATIDAFLTGKTDLDPEIEAALSGATAVPVTERSDDCGCGS
jgi:hypothetical protein